MINITFYKPAYPFGRVCTKIRKIMRLTAVLILISTITVSAKSYSQKVSLTLKNASVETAFEQIRQQTGYSFLWQQNAVEGLSPITLSIHNADINEAVKACINGLPLTYQIHGKVVYIKNKTVEITKPANPSAFYAGAAIPQQFVIRGFVKDSVGNPLDGATIRVQGTGFETHANDKGEFEIDNISIGDTLVISYVGYLTQRIVVRGRTNYLYIMLSASDNELDKTIVEAYGTTSRRFSVGAISTVDASAIEKQPVTNPLLALEGQVPGLSVIAKNGVPGSTTLVQIRGQNSLATDRLSFKPYDQPYFIVDGVPFASGNANISQLSNLANAQSFNGGLNQATGIGAFNGIDPHDIESITILRDADATAIYGSKGANGVVLITTKKGKAGRTSVDLTVNTQLNQVARPIQFLNTQQYLQLRKEAFAADSIIPNDNPNDYSGAYAPDLTIYDQNKYTNWQKIVQGNSTHNTDVHATVSGGSANNTFIISGGYTRSDFNYPGDFADQRYSLHSALTSASANRKFNLTFITDFSYDQNRSAGFGGSSFVTLPPNAPDQIDGNGNLIWSYKGVEMYDNLYAGLKQPTTLQAYNFNTSLSLNYEIIKGLTIGGNVGYNRNTNTEHSINPSTSQAPDIYEPPNISAAFANTVNQALNVEPQINYHTVLGKGTLTALLGGTYQKTTTYSSQTQAYGYSNDAFLGSVDGAATTSVFDNQDLNKYVAAFGRLKYIYDQKYIIELSGRRDGSSNFGPGRQFGSFGSVGAGWIFSEEKAFKNALPFMSYGKLTGSYGTTGSDASQSYQFQALYGPYPYTNTTPFQGIRQNIPKNLYNPDFQWATTKELNIAIDLGFFKDRLLLNATYYRDRQSNQLVAYPLAAQAGFATVFENQNSTVQNKGFEFTVTSTNVKSKNFNWTTSFNLTFNRNKLLAFPNLASSSYATQYVIGQPTSVVFGYRYKDVNPTTGMFEYYAADGSLTSNPNYKPVSQGGDEVVIGNREINYMGGFGNTFTYKRLSLYIFCQFQSSMQPNAISSLYNNPPGYEDNLPAYVLGKYWTGPGDTHATLQRLVTSYNSQYTAGVYAFQSSTGAYTNDTYLRVKTAALSYAFPDAWMKKIAIKGGSIFCNVQNLFTFTNYKFGDPEQPGDFLSFPLQRIIAFGLNLKF
ncbi:SusC/RagA family TonB-linked outer membrane protein [Arachidicoccus ginsenosidimutans]|uniref:SusC/RagA family TonB-linked outer membrane protein n=1 Tax=Arachidicoccus sp. BS20 TaxID=1850526 RepID=UPI0007F086B3|nr:SusC/RagA family TonB-linked outer membrane protein [Arachidicoccus sp. BS20]ANI88977.1 SusC/RagA family TonB-linked outer membrane protein [Arachidicoccus sp. BS20]